VSIASIFVILHCRKTHRLRRSQPALGVHWLLLLLLLLLTGSLG
jgi:hypothetical protein